MQFSFVDILNWLLGMVSCVLFIVLYIVLCIVRSIMVYRLFGVLHRGREPTGQSEDRVSTGPSSLVSPARLARLPQGPPCCSPLVTQLLSHAGQRAKSRGECAPAAGVRRRAVQCVCVAMAVLRHSSTIICRRAGSGHVRASCVARGVCE